MSSEGLLNAQEYLDLAAKALKDQPADGQKSLVDAVAFFASTQYSGNENAANAANNPSSPPPPSILPLWHEFEQFKESLEDEEWYRNYEAR